MGSMKENVGETRRKIDVFAAFDCLTCGAPASAAFFIEEDEITHSEKVPCLNDDQHEFEIVLRKSDDGYSAIVRGSPETFVFLDVDYQWDEPLPEPDAHGIFLDALGEWKENVDAIGVSDGSSSRNRMLFSTLFSIVEAYFSDTIIGAAISNVSVQRQILKLDGLKGKLVKLETILDNPDIVLEMIKTELHGLSFHNIPLVNSICQRAFGASILPQDKADRSLIIAAVNKRHDCVHRNGVDKQGNKHTDITDEYLRKMGDLFVGMVSSLEERMSDTKVHQFFEDLDSAHLKPQ